MGSNIAKYQRQLFPKMAASLSYKFTWADGIYDRFDEITCVNCTIASLLK